jgi:anti-anti-sigma factor
VPAGIRLKTLRISDDAYVCSIGGELDAYSVDALRTELATIAELGCQHVVADLIDVTFMDSAGLGLLLTTADRLRLAGGELVVVSDDPRTLRIFEVTGSGRQFRIERSLATVVEEIGEPLYG